MNRALDSFERYLHDTVDQTHPLIRLALIHYQFEAIHPFLDGNGRVGRILIALLLVHWGLLAGPFLYLSAFFNQNRDQYVNAGPKPRRSVGRSKVAAPLTSLS